MAEARVYQCPVCGAFAREGERACRHCQAALATLRCGRCYELSYPDALHCAGCGHELGLEPIAEPSALQCPDCKRPFDAFCDVSGSLLACAGCGGQFVTHALLRALLESREVLGRAVPATAGVVRGNPLKEPVRYRPCPQCGQIMNRKNFGSSSGIVLDVCTSHGSFFDAGELPRVLVFVERGGLARAQAELAAKQQAPSPSLLASQSHALAHDRTPLSGFDVVDLFTFVVDILTAK
jgi:hypothetical protein